MARPFQFRKQTVDMATPVVRVSRIRRDPPPKVKEVTAAEIKEREAWITVVGIGTFALALFVVLMGISNVAGWSPSQITIHVEQKG